MDALWEASQELTGVDLVQETNELPTLHPAHYADWFSHLILTISAATLAISKWF